MTTEKQSAEILSVIRSLGGKRGWPFEEEAQLALALAFSDAFEGNLDVIRAEVAVILRDWEMCPEPRDAWTLAYKRRKLEIAKIAKCDECDENCWRHVEMPSTHRNYEGKLVTVMISGVERCSCPRGLALRGK